MFPINFSDNYLVCNYATKVSAESKGEDRLIRFFLLLSQAIDVRYCFSILFLSLLLSGYDIDL